MNVNATAILLFSLLNFVAATGRLFAGEIKARVVDGLGRPISNATVQVDFKEAGSDGKVPRAYRLQMLSDQNGLVCGMYDDGKASAKDSSVYIGKTGYTDYTTGVREEYVLVRKFGSRDFGRIARLTGNARKAELKEVLAGDFESKNGEPSLDETMFQYYVEFAPALRELLSDPTVGVRAAQLLSFIGLPEDVRLIARQAPPPKGGRFKNRWAYDVVCSLLSPSSDEEWSFLKTCAANGYDDLWVDAGAIKTLGLIASPRSLEILREVGKINANREEMIAKMVKYIESAPPPLSSTNLFEAAENVARAIKIGNWETNNEPRFNDEGDMALIDCEFSEDRDHYTYTAVFQRVAGIWKLRGVRETLQALMANPPPRKNFLGAWLGYDEDHLMFGRLELNDDGTGLFALSELPDSAPGCYQIRRWSPRRFNLETTIEPAEPNAEVISLENATLGIAALDFEVHGSGWSRKMTLFRETEIQRRANEVRNSLDNLSKSKRRQ